MTMSPDQVEWFRIGGFVVNATVVNTWMVIGVLCIASRLATRRLHSRESTSKWQTFLEIVVLAIRKQIREVSRQEPAPYIAFIGTVFLFVAMSTLLGLVPGFLPPTASLSTTAALAACVFVAVPLFGIQAQGGRAYLSQYVKPSVFMLPFNVMGELSRTLALAVRLYGNIMSGAVIAAILLSFVPLLVPIVMQLFGLLTGMIQAYIFAILSIVYIASATQAHQQTSNKSSIPGETK